MNDFPERGREPIRILILGGGFAGVEVLKNLQKKFQNSADVNITMVSRDNYFLFTPMLPEVSTGMIETRHIATAIRDFCKESTTFYQASVESISLEDRSVAISRPLGKEFQPDGWYKHDLQYDYLVIALGGETNFFGMEDVEHNAFTMKDLDDAIILRNHVISMLEQAELEHSNPELRKKLLTFVVVGGGFSGVEVVGELNDFVRESVRHYYHNIREQDVRVALVHDQNKILPEAEELGDFALQKLTEHGVEFILNSRATGVTGEGVELNKSEETIPTHTLVWTTGVKSGDVIAQIPCQHENGRLKVDNHLEVPGHPQVYALGDCASLVDPRKLEPYPPTAQVATRQGKVVANNIAWRIRNGGRGMIVFDYETKGIMANIGKRTGVANVLGFKLDGFAAWWIWRAFYLARLPAAKKRIRVMTDWAIDLFFKRDVTMIKRSAAKLPVQEKDRSMDGHQGLRHKKGKTSDMSEAP